MRILFIGDVVGSLGREALATYVPKLKKKYRPQVTIAMVKMRHLVGELLARFIRNFCKMCRCCHDGQPYVGQQGYL